jgi:diguanylate cyclase (GGDEF)-like protein
MLDFLTVFIFSTALTTFVCAVTGAAWFFGDRESDSRYWFIASLLQLTGTFLMLIGDYVPLIISGYVAGTASIAATGFLALGYRKLYGQSASSLWPVGAAIVFSTAINLIRYMSNGADDGVYLIYAGGAINLAVASAAIWRGNLQNPLPFGRIAAWALTIYAAVYMAVAPAAFLFPIRFIDGKPVAFWLEGTTIPLVILNLGSYLMTLIVKLERATERQRHLALHDGLTGTLNRRALIDRARAEKDKGGAYAVLDLDYFKRINDTYGHLAGDEALRRFARNVRGMLPAGCSIGRLGGEEFGMVLPGFEPEAAQAFLENVRRATEALSIELETGESVSFTVSCGVTVFSGNRDDHERIFAEADHALYEAKARGRNRLAVFEPAMLAEATARRMRMAGAAPAAGPPPAAAEWSRRR